MLPFAVHISANVLADPWWIGGLILLIPFGTIGLTRLREGEMPRLAVVTAALFVASSIHIPVGLFTVHLVLNGLAGLMLGRRCLAAIPMATLMQAWLLGHGDLTTWGVNSCVMSLPALLARPLFRWTLDSTSSALGANILALGCLFHPWSWMVTAPVVWAARRWIHRQPRIPTAGFIVGSVCVLLTAFLQALVLTFGGETNFWAIAVVSLAMHMPLALIEGVILAAMVSALDRARPDLVNSWLQRVPQATRVDESAERRFWPSPLSGTAHGS